MKVSPSRYKYGGMIEKKIESAKQIASSAQVPECPSAQVSQCSKCHIAQVPECRKCSSA